MQTWKAAWTAATNKSILCSCLLVCICSLVYRRMCLVYCKCICSCSYVLCVCVCVRYADISHMADIIGRHSADVSGVPVDSSNCGITAARRNLWKEDKAETAHGTLSVSWDFPCCLEAYLHLQIPQLQGPTSTHQEVYVPTGDDTKSKERFKEISAVSLRLQKISRCWRGREAKGRTP